MEYLWIVLLLQTISIAAECVADSCLLALRPTPHISGRHAAAQGFCTAYLQDPTIDVPDEAKSACQDENDELDQARIASACACEFAPTETTPTLVTPAQITSPPAVAEDSFVEPCAIVSSSFAAQIAAAPSTLPTVSAQLAHECLNSVPLNKTAAIQLVDAIAPYLEWQSDLAWKKDPPADYDCPAHDLIAALDQVRRNLVANQYANEYVFQIDLYRVFLKGCDGHIILYPDAATQVFIFGRQRSLVSVSEDGRSLPVIKLYEDVYNSSGTASYVTKINGIEASTYISKYGTEATSYRDADAVYNSMFFNKGSFAETGWKGSFSGGGRLQYIYPGPTTTFTFANGSSLILENTARIFADLHNVANGQQFYDKFCVVHEDGHAAEGNGSDAMVYPYFASEYPQPVIATDDSMLSGHYLDGQGYEDVAVLNTLSFYPKSISQFQEVAQQFLVDAKRDGKTKIIIDLSCNEGGYILQSYDLFRQFFPTIEQEGNTRWRAGRAFMAIAEIFSAGSDEFDPATATDSEIERHQSWFHYYHDLNSNNEPFRSFEDKYGPYTIKGDNFTNTMRWKLNDTLTTSNDTYGMGIDITGYGPRQNFTQHFDAKNIIMLYNGFCGSACHIFSEFMRVHAGVKSIAMGGRPKAGLIQGVGGNKGALVLSFEAILKYAQMALPNASEAQAEILEELSPLPLQRSRYASLNVRDYISPEHLGDGIPSQYIREESDCRLFYTEESINDVTALWKAAADAAFNGKKCAYGSLPERL
ncbi:CELP0031 Effector like protein [Blumeria hordei DH14]|uniref:CELP0031 Effector like protein n=1 Tax=Blumeria graminis f. sp. hordei (strain DH14) TaxID=546991 RepID=N1J9T1_BLUG1|nr:CELP0031 Effector like protein [Blumeria hordei DH14]